MAQGDERVMVERDSFLLPLLLEESLFQQAVSADAALHVVVKPIDVDDQEDDDWLEV